MKIILSLVLALFSLIYACPSWAVDEVFVTNFPRKQITQDVNSIPSTLLVKMENVEVGTFTTLDVMDLSPKFLLKTDGYEKATVSLFGFSKSEDFPDCQVGVILLPNEEAIWKAWQIDRAMVLSNKMSTRVTDNNKYFQGQIEMDIHFPSYLVGFFNTCSANVELNMYSYLK